MHVSLYYLAYMANKQIISRNGVIESYSQSQFLVAVTLVAV